MPSSLPQMATEEEDAQSFADCVQEMYEDGDVAKSFFKSLAPETRAEVLRSMKEELEMARHESKAPGREQLFRLALLAGLPMIGFGFMDNAIMIVAGDYLDTQFCYHLGLSTLFAAALGNVVSDVAGVATAGPIETLMRNLGMKGHGLTPGQLKHPMVLSFKYLGTAVGVAFGCFIGMFPLLWPKEFRLWPTREDVWVGWVPSFLSFIIIHS